MAGGLSFTIEIDALRDLSVDASRADALVTVTARATGRAEPAPRLAEVLIMDRSLSMMSGNKMPEARRAACAAIDALPDGALLGIIAGSRKAESVFPATGGLTAIDAKTRAEARRQVMRLRPEGGTEIGRWLVAASQLFATEPAAAAIRHAVLYTDGKNEHETPAALGTALDACTDRFICDVRGLGGDWDYTQLLPISEALHGDATAVLDIADLAGDFTQLIAAVQRLVVPRTYLRLSPGGRFLAASVAQTHPVRVDLTQRQQPADGTAVDIPLGSWQPDTRRYQVTLRFTPDALPFGEDLRAMTVELLAEAADGERERYADAALIVRRHATPGPGAAIPHSHTQVERERELAATMQACTDAWLYGRAAEADDELDHAIRLARAVADPVRLRLLEGVAVTGPDGKARVRRDVTPGEMQRLALESTKTNVSIARVSRAGEAARPPAEAHACRACGETTYAWNPRHCEACGNPFGESASPSGERARP
jgi:Ca-activated chloride channel family protein